MRRWLEEHPEQRELNKIAQFKRRYSMTYADYYRMLEEQGGGCAICGYVPRKRRLSVDHDHKTGQIRGLLCVSCNRGLPWFADSPENLAQASEYLYKSRIK